MIGKTTLKDGCLLKMLLTHIGKLSGNDSGDFPETFSRYWKKFLEKPLSHDPFLGKNFSWVSTHEIYLEIVSGKSPESRPEIRKSGKSLEKVSGKSPESFPESLPI